MQKIKIEKAIKCYKYRDLETAIFIISKIIDSCPEYRLLYGILLYENREYNRAIYHLNGLVTTTAVFYKALCYKHIKKYQEAIACIVMLRNASTLKDIDADNWTQQFVLDVTDTEFLYQLLGEIYVLLGQTIESIKWFTHSMFKNPLILAANYLLEEMIKVTVNKAHINDSVTTYYFEILKAREKIEEQEKDFRSNLENKSNNNILDSNSEYSDTLYNSISDSNNTFNNKIQTSASLKNMFDGLPEENYICKASKIPYHGSYYLVQIANLLARYNQDKKSIAIFECLRTKDPTFMGEMDSYSTLLWKNKKENLLGLLAKDCIEIAPQHHNTWIAIGNYHSLKGKSNESLLCFRRSLAIRENTHAYTLLGFEYNARYQFVDAQECFKAAIAMSPSNDRALFGLGISNSETFNNDLALLYFSKALEIHPFSMPMNTYLIRFYVKNRELGKALEKICKAIFEPRKINCTNCNDMAACVVKNAGKFHEMEELMLCELAEIWYISGYSDLAAKILKFIACRTSTYFAKKALIETVETEK